MQKPRHQPVLLKKVLDIYSQENLNIFVDGTLGAGGHSAALMKHHPEMERLIGIDQDPVALKLAKENLHDKEKISFIEGNFYHLKELLKEIHLDAVDGILVDIGVSSMQLDEAERGFSFMREGPLDMRMCPELDLSAGDIVNKWPEPKLTRILEEYGEVPKAKKVALAIVEARKRKKLETTIDLANVVSTVLPCSGRKNFLSCVFQALRIAVNGELEALQGFLPQAIELLKPGGILSVITFHSLEDRIAKETFRRFAKEGILEEILKKPYAPTREDIRENSRCRSAKLRCVRKI